MPSMNGAALTTHEATIQTAQVEIQVLKVGKKQVTMGLFRQLPNKDITAPSTARLLGDPWGHVEYWWDGDGRQQYESGTYISGPRLHLVWQDHERLYRSIVYQDPLREYLWEYEHRVQQAAEPYWLATHPGASVTYESRGHPRPWLDAPRVHHDYHTLVSKTLATPDVTTLYTAWRQAVDEREAYAAAWAAQWKALCALPQLFIAV